MVTCDRTCACRRSQSRWSTVWTVCHSSANLDVCILGLQRRQQRVEAGTDSAVDVVTLLGQGLLPGIGGFLSPACCFTPGIVRQHSAEQPGKPRADTFTLAEVERPADRAQVELLQHLLRSICRAKMTGKEAQKITAIFGQCRRNCRIQSLHGTVRCWLLYHASGLSRVLFTQRSQRRWHPRSDDS